MLKKILLFFTWKNKLLKSIEGRDYQWSSVLNEWQGTEYKLNEAKLEKLGRILFERLLKKYLEDLKLTSTEWEDLEKLVDFCKISSGKIQKIKAKFADDTIQKLSLVELADNVLTLEKKTAMYDLADKLAVSHETVDKVNVANALKIFRNALEAAADTRRLSEDKEKELQALAKNLDLPRDTAIAEVKKFDWTHFKLLDRVEKGSLPEIESAVPMQAREICHFLTDAVRLETKVKTVGYTGGSRGVSIRIAKGISYRVGSHRSQPIKKEVTFRYPGTLIITNKRIIFAAVQKGFSIPLNKLTNIEPYSDGIGLQKDSRYYLMQFDKKHTELAELIITSAVNKL